MVTEITDYLAPPRAVGRCPPFGGEGAASPPPPTGRLCGGTAATTTGPVGAPAAGLRRRPWFLADWTDVVFLHYAIDPALLQQHVPFPLDLHEGQAYVSLVAFTQRNLRPRLGGRLAAWLHRPVACHEFLNLRTYVRHEGEPGILFLAEWVPNRLSALVGPLLYGLPLRLGRLAYKHEVGAGRLRGAVAAFNPQCPGGFRFEGKTDARASLRPAAPGLDAYLVERYAAYTRRGDASRRFRIAHAPWQLAPADVAVNADDLLAAAAPWWTAVRYASAHYSPGVHDVCIGGPERLDVRAHQSRSPHGCGVSSFGVRPARPHKGWRNSRTTMGARDHAFQRSAPNMNRIVKAAAALPAALATTAAILLILKPQAPAWAVMWAVAFALYFSAKWITLRGEMRRRSNLPVSGECRPAPGAERGDTPDSVRREDPPITRSRPDLIRAAGYLLAWPGMDAHAFFRREKHPAPRASEWFEPLMNAIVGAALVWGVASHLPSDFPLLRGWAGMFGLVLLLHFGTLHLAALLWQRAGVHARPIMGRPTRSTRLAEFWGERWNRGFHQLAADLCFRPLWRRFGTAAAMLATFAASGIVHDLVISLPARAGFGQPTLYFLIQGLGVLLERRPSIRRGLARRPWRGWLFTCAFTAIPLPLLFHEPFVTRVMLPFLVAIGAGPR